jgi:methionyl-tRNA formyltransferase
MSADRDLKIVFIGCVEEGRRSLETLLEMGEDVAAMFTLNKKRAARVSGAIEWEGLCEAHGVPLHYVRRMHDPEPLETLRGIAPDLIFCIGWTQLLRKPVLEIPRLGCIGFHASLLPRYRGRAPVNWVIIHGERETGNTMMLLDEGVDTGDIVAQRRFPIDDHDTCKTVYDKVARSEVEMIREVMPLIHQGRMPRTPQDHAQATEMPKRRPEDGLIDWTRPTDRLYDWVRALTHPYPGAFTDLEGRRVLVWKASRWRPGPGGGAVDEPRPGAWRMEGEPPALLVGTGDGELKIERGQIEGGDEVDGAVLGLQLIRPREEVP